MSRRGRKAGTLAVLALLVLLFVGWLVFVVLVLQPMWIREVGTW